MNLVQPIRDKNKILAMYEIAKAKHPKYYIMLLIGFNSGLRISDILKLRVCDLDTTIKEKKTGKNRMIISNKSVMKDIKDYIEEYELEDNDYLIFSRQKDKDGRKKAITRERADQVISEIAKQIGLKEISSHSMRKSFGYHYYKKTKDIAKLQMIFNHSSQNVTLAYIGVTSEEIQKSLEDFRL